MLAAGLIDVELARLLLAAPEVLPDQEQRPVAHDEDDVDRVALCPLRGLEDGEHGDGVEAEEGPADGHHRARREAARLVVVLHHHVYPGEEDGRDAGREAEEVVAGDWQLC